MQLTQLSGILKPVTLSIGMAAAMPVYAAVDSYSGIYSVITDKAIFESVKQADSENFLAYVPKLRFQSLYEQWRNDTRFTSSASDIVSHEAFKAIVAMGEAAVPYIVEEIDNTPSTLVWALNFIFQKKISNNPDTTVQEACRLWVKELSR